MVAPTPPSSPKLTASTRRQQTVYHPVVSLMVQQNTMRDCHQIKDMYAECTSFYSKPGAEEPFVCRTAKKYHAQCLQEEKL